MRKYILIFISVMLVCFALLCIGSRFLTQKNGVPPMTWSEIWDNIWIILILSIIAGILTILGIYDDSDKTD